MSEEIPATKLKNDANYLAKSFIYIQIAVASLIIVSVLYAIANNLICRFFESFPLLTVLIIIHDVLFLLAYGLSVIGIFRIVLLLKSEVHVFYLLSAVAAVFYFFVSEGIDFYHFIVIMSGGGYSLSELGPIAMLIFPPLGMISLCAVALGINKHFPSLTDRKMKIYALTTTIALIWLLNIIIASIQWWQNRDVIEFSLRFLVIRYHRWQIESIYRYIYFFSYGLPVLTWLTWLFFSLHFFRHQLDSISDRIE